ncbi:hypothetical protein B0F90DRAFT_1726231, partial [Multifurca ochricompacta]
MFPPTPSPEVVTNLYDPKMHRDSGASGQQDASHGLFQTVSKTNRGDSEGYRGSKDSTLWWYHPIFEARAKADIRRTLRQLLPADPAQDPPSPVGEVMGRWRAEVRPRQARARMWAERLEDAFGPGPLDRGLGRKPRRVAV